MSLERVEEGWASLSSFLKSCTIFLYNKIFSFIGFRFFTHEVVNAVSYKTLDWPTIRSGHNYLSAEKN